MEESTGTITRDVTQWTVDGDGDPIPADYGEPPEITDEQDEEYRCGNCRRELDLCDLIKVGGDPVAQLRRSLERLHDALQHWPNRDLTAGQLQRGIDAVNTITAALLDGDVLVMIDAGRDAAAWIRCDGSTDKDASGKSSVGPLAAYEGAVAKLSADPS